MAELPKKQYGLILPKKDQPVSAPALLKKPSVFNESDSDEEAPGDWVQKSLAKEKYGGARSRHSKAEIERILKEDPTVYQYDEVYDDMERTRNETLAAKKVEKAERKPKYVQQLMANAERRKKENERRIAKQIQKEREAEGEEFADKEVFVTAAYKKKLEEMKAAEEKEKEQDRLEEIGDVTKQRDLGGFYRHLFERVVLDDREGTAVTKIVVDSDDEQPVPKEDSKPREKKPVPKSRQYRKRKSDAESSDDETAVKRRIPPELLTGKNNKVNDSKETSKDTKNCESDVPKEIDNPDADSASSEGEHDSASEEKTNNVDKKDEVERDDDAETKIEDVFPKEEKPKRSIWEKRTVGEVFDAAVQRYYERKANRLTAQGN